MKPAKRVSTASSKDAPGSFLGKLRKRKIIETLAAFIGGGWLTYEIVHWILVVHFHLPEKLLDITLITLLGALLCTLVWRWFGGRDKPAKFKPEVILVPLAILVTVILDLNLVLHLKSPESETFPASKWTKSIAVLPFIDMSEQKDQDYFCDGMTEELINRLSHIEELKVPARTSAFMFKGKAEDIRDIGRKLDVRTALEGSIRKAGNRLRVTAQLVNIADGYHLWSETYDRELKDVFAVQDEISLAIVNALKLKLDTDEGRRMSERPIDNVAAYECYLKANAEMGRQSEDGLDRAVQYLQKGLEIAGDNALLYSELARAYRYYVDLGFRQEEYIKSAEGYANKALALDPDFPEAHVVIGTIQSWFHGNQQEAVRQFKRALALNPNEPGALRQLALIYILVGQIPAALPLLDRYNKVDPLPLSSHYSIRIHLYFWDGRYGLALEPSRQWYQSEPLSPRAQAAYAWTLALNNKLDEAFQIIDQNAKLAPNSVLTKLGLLLKYGLLKENEKAFQVMTPDFVRTCKRDPSWSHIVVLALALLDAKKEAIDWLENSVNQGFLNYPALERNPCFENLRGEVRFKNLMERVKKEWEHFKV